MGGHGGDGAHQALKPNQCQAHGRDKWFQRLQSCTNSRIQHSLVRSKGDLAFKVFPRERERVSATATTSRSTQECWCASCSITRIVPNPESSGNDQIHPHHQLTMLRGEAAPKYWGLCLPLCPQQSNRLAAPFGPTGGECSTCMGLWHVVGAGGGEVLDRTSAHSRLQRWPLCSNECFEQCTSDRWMITTSSRTSFRSPNWFPTLARRRR